MQKSKFLRIIKQSTLVFLSLLFTFLSPLATFAIDDATLDFNAENNITFYDKSDGICEGMGSFSIGDGELPAETTRYLDNSGVREKAANNLDRYEYAASQTGLPWQAIAALHYREAGLRSKGSILNGQEIKDTPYTNVDGRTIYPDINEDAKSAAETLVKMAKNVYEVELSTSSDIEAFGKAFLSYNRGYMYKNSKPETPYTDSPYVMNGLDENHQKMTWKHADSYYGDKKLNGLEGSIDPRPGALAVMKYLGSNPDSGCSGSISEGGLTEEQAKIFMMRYGENKNNDSAKVSKGLWAMCNGGGSNCVTFSAFFIRKFSSLKNLSDLPGHGKDIVKNLVNNYSLPKSSTPSVWSVFSTNSDPIYGHTGIVLGIHDGKYIIGHASCSNKGDRKSVV